jgi:hypothetical protein
MKYIYNTLAAVVLVSTCLWAQAPSKISYQAVVRDGSNNLLTNQGIGMQISILQGSATGTPVYVETQSPTTNDNGLVSIEIGMGTTSDDFSSIDWAAGPYFIKTETDPTAVGGTTYTITGTSQLMSVPYALYAANSGSSIPGPEGPQGPAGNDGAVGPTGVQGPAGTDGADGIGVAQTLSQVGNNITLSDAGGSVSITDNDTQLDAAGVTTLGFVSGAHAVDTDTQLDEAAVDTFVANNGYLTTEVDGSVTNEIQDLQLVGNNLTITSNGSAATIDLTPYLDNTDTQLSEVQVDAFVANNNFIATDIDGSVTLGEVIRTISYATANGPDDGMDNGQIVSRILDFTKKKANTKLRISYTDNFRVWPIGGAAATCRWQIRLNGLACPSQDLIYDMYEGVAGDNNHRSQTVVGYCDNVAAGARQIQVWVGPVPGWTGGDCHTGWFASTWVLEVEEVN